MKGCVVARLGHLGIASTPNRQRFEDQTYYYHRNLVDAPCDEIAARQRAADEKRKVEAARRR